MQNFDHIPYQERKSHKAYKISRMTWFGKAVYYAGTMRCYHNGDGMGWVWRWWNPITYPVAFLTIVASILISGIPNTIKDRRRFGFGMQKYFLENPDRLKWW